MEVDNERYELTEKGLEYVLLLGTTPSSRYLRLCGRLERGHTLGLSGSVRTPYKS